MAEYVLPLLRRGMGKGRGDELVGRGGQQAQFDGPAVLGGLGSALLIGTVAVTAEGNLTNLY